MLNKINRQECITKYPILPLREYNIEKEDYLFAYPKIFSGHTLTLSSKSYKGHIKLLGLELKTLATDLNSDKLIFLGDMNTPWLFREKYYSDSISSKKGFQYLGQHKIGKKFNGGLQVPLIELPLFIKHLATLVRSNGIVQYVHFTDTTQNIIGNICQYGNLHISSSTKKADTILKKAISKTKFEYISGLDCINKFSKKVAIKERKFTT